MTVHKTFHKSTDSCFGRSIAGTESEIYIHTQYLFWLEENAAPSIMEAVSMLFLLPDGWLVTLGIGAILVFAAGRLDTQQWP